MARRPTYCPGSAIWPQNQGPGATGLNRTPGIAIAQAPQIILILIGTSHDRLVRPGSWICPRACVLVAALALVGTTVHAAPAPGSAKRIDTIQQELNKERLNQNTVAIVTGAPSGTYLQVAYDMSAVLDAGDDLRVLPVIGKGSVQNLRDVLYLKGVDMGIAQTADLNRLKAEDPGIGSRLVYMTKLYNEELHVLARPRDQDDEGSRGQGRQLQRCGRRHPVCGASSSRSSGSAFAK